jgi:hypothetical protein
MKELQAALRRQKETLTVLLKEAEITDDAESLLCDALAGMPQAGAPDAVELEMLLRVDRACAEYARLRGRAYRGLGRQRVKDLRPAMKHQRERRR